MLKNLKTNLKSLRFGNDRIGGGSSNQPFIQKPIPSGTSTLGNQNTDFLLRDGILAPQDSVEDVLRLGKYFTDLKSPSGLLFIAKQNLLSRTAVRSQQSTGVVNEGTYTPLSTLTQAGVNAFGIHVNKQGFNPFGVITTYSDIVTPRQPIQSNRLYTLYNAKIQNNTTDPVLLSYIGGPGSILGIGNTNIKISSQRTGINNIDGKGIINRTYQTTRPIPEINYNSLAPGFDGKGKFGASIVYNNSSVITQNSIDLGVNNNGQLLFNNNVYILGNFPSTNNNITSVGNTSTLSQNEMVEGKTSIGDDITPYQSNPITTRPLIDFRKSLRNGLKESTTLSNSPNYSEKNIENRVNIGDPGNKANKNLLSYTKGYNGSGSASPNSYDKITFLPLYRSSTVKPSETTNDLVKFRIAAIDNDDPSQKVFIHFRALLEPFQDNYSSDWSSTQYTGRGEKFYNYNGFDRKFSLSFTVAAQSKIELIPMYKKLNYLASTLMPDYSKFGYMRGSLIQLTIGGYLYEQPGFLTGMSLGPMEESPWEIGINDEGNFDSSVKELPHVIKVSGFSFTPIHEFVPRKVTNIDNQESRFIALSTEGHKQDNKSNYNS